MAVPAIRRHRAPATNGIGQGRGRLSADSDRPLIVVRGPFIFVDVYSSPRPPRLSPAMKTRSSGFTLIELLVVLVVLAVLVSIGVPNLRTLIQNNRATAQANELLTGLQYARMEALKRKRPVSVCPSRDGATCGTDWAEGWIVVLDGNAPGANTVNIQQVLRVWQGLGHGTTVDAVNLPPNRFVRFLGNGAADRIGNQNFPVTLGLRIYQCRGPFGRNVEVARSGRVGVRRVNC
jgi:type IV fimbrial biogenesis protein FimT